MSIPLFCYTDASFEFGNNTIQENVESALENKYKRVAIVNTESVGSTMKFIQTCDKKKLNKLIGVTLKVSIPKREHLLWYSKYKKNIIEIYELLKIKSGVPEFVFSHIQQIHQLIIKTKKSTSKVKLNKLFTELNLIGSMLTAELSCDDFKYACLLMNGFDFSLVQGGLIFIPQDENGYKNLLKLVSTKAIKKHHNIKTPDDIKKDEVLTLDDIKKHSNGLIIIDPVNDMSVLGGFYKLNNNKNEYTISDVFDLTELPITHIGLDYPLKSKYKWLITNLSKHYPVIPCPTTHFTKQELYFSYSVKVAIHKKQTIHDVGFLPPDPEKYIYPHNELELFYRSHQKEYSLDLSFWSKISDTVVSVGKIHLPNYDMPVLDIINYALILKKEITEPYTDISYADCHFKEWLHTQSHNSLTFDEFKQKRLNDFCLHKISYFGVIERVKERFKECYKEYLSEYLHRHEMEYKVIESMGFSGYFLIEYDFVNHAREINVPVGDGRGSAAGSLIVYGMGITDVDPIEYDLQFERFLNPERVSMPDIDVDFGDGGNTDRMSVLNYISQKYQDKDSIYPSSSQIANINTYQLKSSISAVRKGLGLSMFYDYYLKGLIASVEVFLGISEPEKISWSQLMENDLILNKIRSEPNLRLILTIAQELTDKQSTYGIHAGGLVISPTVIVDYSAIECDDEGKFFTQFNKDDIELAGLIKFDILGLRTLSIIDEATRQIKKNYGINLDVRKINKHDQRVFDLLCYGDLSDIFQLESGGMRKLVGNLQPQNIEELAVLSALYRPGALQSGMVEEFVDVKFGNKPPTYDHYAIKKATESTFGCIVFQEQVMSIVRLLAGYSLGQADLLRRAMGKKKIEVMLKEKAVYNNRALSYWRESNIKKCEPLGFPYKMDVCLLDLSLELKSLKIYDLLDSDGYFSVGENVEKALTILLNLNDEMKKTLNKRLMDYSYVVKLFKDHYKLSLKSMIESCLIGLQKERINEVADRIYYAFSQFIRFNQIFNKIEKFAGYGFNKSHAISYAIITYKTAYLKCYYPAEFYSAALTYKKIDLLNNIVSEASQRFGIKTLTPNVNKSYENFVADGKKFIRYGLGKLRGLINVSVDIVDERNKNGCYLSLFDFSYRLLNKKVKLGIDAVTSLAVSGGFDPFIDKKIISRTNVNGRYYLIWLFKQMKSGHVFKDDTRSILHECVDKMNEYEWLVYISAVSLNSYLKKNELIDVVDLAIIAKRGVFDANAINEINTNKETQYGLLVESKKESPESLTPFEVRYLTIYEACKHSNSFTQKWMEHLTLILNKSVTETLNHERYVSGVYMTSEPIKALNVAMLVEKEPPSSIIDGCPVEIKQIDDSFDGRKVTTYGIVRNIVVKHVKKEDSQYYKEKMLFFDLEHGNSSVNCLIFGSKLVTKFYDKIITDGVVMMLGGDVKINNFGTTLNIKALKRYYPDVDEHMIIID